MQTKTEKLAHKITWEILRAMNKRCERQITTLYQNTENELPVEFIREISTPTYIEPQWGYLISGSGYLHEEPMQINAYPHPWHYGIPSPKLFLKNKNFGSHKLKRYPVVISLRYFWEWNYYHFYADVLGKISLLDEAGIDETIPIVLGNYVNLVPFAKQILERGALKNRNWIIQEDYIIADKVIYCTPKRNIRTRYDHLLSLLDTPPPKRNSHDKVFLTRGPAKTRNIINFNEIQSVAAGFGFRSVDTALLTITEQADLFADTRYLIAIHGAGFINMIFRRAAPLSFLELHAENYITVDPRCLAEAYDYHWDHLAGIPDNLPPQHANFTLSPEALSQSIMRMLKF